MCAILAQGLRGEEIFLHPPTLHRVGATRAMELISRMGSKPTPLRLPSHGALSVGRSQSADYQVDRIRISAVHVQITEGPDPTTFTVTDVSRNGTGLVAHGTTPAAATMLHRASTTVKIGTGILLPMEQPGGIVQKTVNDVLRMDRDPGAA